MCTKKQNPLASSIAVTKAVRPVKVCLVGVVLIDRDDHLRAEPTEMTNPARECTATVRRPALARPTQLRLVTVVVITPVVLPTSMSSRNVDGALETRIGRWRPCRKLARREPLENHMHGCADQPPRRDDTVEHGMPCRVLLALNDRCKRVPPSWVYDLITSRQLNNAGREGGSDKNLPGKSANDIASGEARHEERSKIETGKPFRVSDLDQPTVLLRLRPLCGDIGGGQWCCR